MDNTDEPQDNSMGVENGLELEEEKAPAAKTGKETSKDAEIMKDKDKFVCFLNLFKTLNVNLPLIELIEKVPKYTKLLKEMMARRKKINVREQVNLSASCSVIISRQVPWKLKDSGRFSIPIEIGSIHFNRTLCDFGVRINLIPLSIFEKLRLGNLKTTQIKLQLPNLSSVHPNEVLEDVLVKEDREILILLRRPFLATSRSTIYLEKNELTMNINSETEIFKCGYQLNEENGGY
ncbi:UPF0746 protein [Gossypium australe]|uniref:UPF0746 protein n=1 Tax=Gossypium australe TaxID=47621 RepID=A0A5B6VAP6_9ROSI|nr:UPF0746 protein [Gossypium australe]